MRRVALILVLTFASTPLTAFDRSPWQSPIIVDKAGITEIVVGSAPAGLFYRENINPNMRYKLSVKGAGGPITMRLRIDDEAPEYLAAPRGTTDRTITGASRLELLFYSDKPASYRLENIEINECQECRTIDDLRKRILDEVPELAEASGLRKAIALMKWAANTADQGVGFAAIPNDFESWPAEKMVYEFFDIDRGGVACGGYSVFFQRILQEFAIDAFTVNFGIPNSSITHVTVIVPYNGIFYMLDPTFNVIFMRRGRMLDVEDAINALQTGSMPEIGIQEYGLQNRDFIGDANSFEAEYDRICVKRETIPSGLQKCLIGDNSFISAYRRFHAHDWNEVTLDDAFLFRLMLKGFFSVGPSTNPASRARFIAMLRQHHIAFHHTSSDASTE